MRRGVLRTRKEGPERTGQMSSSISPWPWGAHFTQHTAYCPGWGSQTQPRVQKVNLNYRFTSKENTLHVSNSGLGRSISSDTGALIILMQNNNKLNIFNTHKK